MGSSKRDIPFAFEAFKRGLYHNLFMVDESDKKPFSPIDTVLEIDPIGYADLGPVGTMIGNYRKWQINERYGLSFIDWCNLPRHIVNLMIDDSRRETEATEAKVKEIEKKEQHKAKYGE